MSMSDPVADMLTRIRNAFSAGHETTDVHQSQLKTEIARIMKREGYITDYVVEGGGAKKTLRIYLKYVGGKPAIRGLGRISRSGLRRYAKADKIPLVLGGMGIVIMSTSSGIMTGNDCRSKGLGGEMLCKIW